MATQREILFILRMQNQTQAAIGQLKKDLVGMSTTLNGVLNTSGRLNTARGPTNITKDIEKMQREAAVAVQRLRDVETLIQDINEGFGAFDGTPYGAALDSIRQQLVETGESLANADLIGDDELAQMMEFRRISVEQLGDAYNMTADEAADAARKQIEELKKVEDQQKRTNKSAFDAMKVYRRLRLAAGAALAFLGGNAIIREADAWKNLTGQLRLVTDSEENLLAVRERIVEVANNTYSDLSSTASLYTKLAQRADQLGRSQEQMIELTQTFSQAMQVGGSTAQESAAATRQFAQAVAAGSLRGDELNSIIENAPGLAMAFEEGLRAMGKEVTSLKSYIADANPTVRELLDALDTQVESIEEKFNKLPTTVSQGLQVLRNAFTEFIGKVDEASGATNGISQFLLRLAALFRDPKFIQAVASLANIIGRVLNTVLDLLIGAFNFLRENIGYVIAALILLGIHMAKLGFQALITQIATLALGFYSKAAAIGVATLAMKAFRAALITTGIGALIVGLGYLIQKLIEFGESTQEVNGFVVDGWAKLRAYAVGAWAAIQKAVEVAWDNIKTIFGRMLSGIAQLGLAFLRLKSGDVRGAWEAATSGVDTLAGSLDNLRSVSDEAGAAFQQAFDNSILESVAASFGSVEDVLGGNGVNTEVPDAPPIISDEDLEAAKELADAIQDVRDRIRDMQEATTEQNDMNEAIRQGARAVRELTVEQVRAREYRETERALLKAGASEAVAAEEATKAATAAANMEISKQAQELSDLSASLDEATRAIRENNEEMERGLQIAFEQDPQRQRDLIYQDLYQSKLDELTRAYRDGEYTLEEYADAYERAAEAARQFADGQQRGADASVVLDLIEDSKTEAELAADAYTRAKIALDAWLGDASNLALPNFGEQARRAAERLEEMRPPEDMWDAVTQGLRQFGKESEVTLMDMRDLAADSFGKIGDAVADLVVEGKFNFKELARSIIADIARMIVQALIFKAIMSIFGGGVSAGTVARLTPDVTNTIDANPGIFHTGGIAGVARAMRGVNGAMFAGAQRYHSGGIAGLKPGEVPIIAKRGEAIMPTVRLPNGQMGVQAQGGMGSFSPNININLSGGGGGDGMTPEKQQKLAALLEDEMQVFLQRKFEEWNRPGGQLDMAVRQRR